MRCDLIGRVRRTQLAQLEHAVKNGLNNDDAAQLISQEASGTRPVPAIPVVPGRTEQQTEHRVDNPSSRAYAGGCCQNSS